MNKYSKQQVALNIRYFGPLTDITKLDKETISLEKGTAILQLKEELIKRYENLASCPFRFAVDQEMVPDSHIIDNNCEISLFPPFAGG